MRKNLIYLLFSVTLLCAALTACSDNDDLDSTSSMGTPCESSTVVAFVCRAT